LPKTVPQTLPRKGGVRLDPDRIDYETALRGVTQRQLAARAGVPETRISRARHGHPVSERTLRKITEALLGIPLMVGGDLLVLAPEKKIAAASTSAATHQVIREVHGSDATPAT